MASARLKISKKEARLLALASQGLTKANYFGIAKDGVLAAVQRLGYIQIDTLSVVARAHHHTLWTRADAYLEKHLDELVKERKVFEYWSHAAAFLPIEDYRFTLPRKEEFRKGRAHWFGKDKKVMKYVLDRIKAEGPLQSRDFEHNTRRSAWFDWKPAKNALEQLFHDGTLMVSGRSGFQKIYDLAERVLPAGIETTMPTPSEYAEFLVQRALRAHGLASAREIAYLRKVMAKPVQTALHHLVKKGTIQEIGILGMEELYYAALNPRDMQADVKNTVLLSPFDNSVIMRNRLKDLFDFDFGIECYLPVHKRKYGYFCLPVLHGDEFIARLDPKADRRRSVFVAKHLFFEPGSKISDKKVVAVANAIKRFAAFNACREIQLEHVSPAVLKAELKPLLV